MTTPGQLLSLPPGWDNMNNMSDLSLQGDLLMDFRNGLPQQIPGQHSNLPLKKRSYAEMNTPMDNNATTYGDISGLKKLNFLDNILEQTKVNTQLAGVDNSQFFNNPFGNFQMLQPNAKGFGTQKPKKLKRTAKKQTDVKAKKLSPKRNSPKKAPKATQKNKIKLTAKSPTSKPTKPATKKTTTTASLNTQNAGKRAATPKGAATKKTAFSKSISPRNGQKKATNKSTVSADARDTSELEKRERKNEREKHRRLLVNQQFNRLAELLGLPKERNTDKVTILAKAVKTLESFQGSFIPHQLPAVDQNLSIPF